ncbi:MAG TPA: ATP-binding protein [Polyangia bacterium]|nr:ATP-binding protein [Polyangia bacterium]
MFGGILMSSADPHKLIGKRESERLEFKSADALKKPFSISREVVAFLNAKGGDIWIGVEEAAGVAVHIDPVPRPDEARDALHNHLIDVIEPSPGGDEVCVDVIADTIRVQVLRGDRRPYALLKDRGRQFILRVGSRVREMDREEIADAFGGASGPTDELEEMRAAQRKEIDSELKVGPARFWWQLAPVPTMDIGIEHADPATRKFISDLFTDPRASGNRRNGWTVIFPDNSLPRFSTGRVEHTFGRGEHEHGIRLSDEGQLTCWAPRVRLDRDWDTSGRQISPFALLELPVSAFRVFSKLLDRFADKRSLRDGVVVCSASIGGLKGSRLRGGSPNLPQLPWEQEAILEEDRIEIEPFEVEMSQLIAKPDAAAYRLVRRIYEQLGLGEGSIPQEFDRTERVLRLPG